MKYKIEDFLKQIQVIIAASGLKIENGTFAATADTIAEEVMKKTFHKCKEYFLDETRTEDGKAMLIKEAVESAKNTIKGEQQKLRAEIAKVLQAAIQSAMKPVGEKTELDVFRREMKEQEIRQHIRAKYDNDPIKMQAELGSILERDRLWASAALNDVTGEIPKAMEAACMDIQESFMKANSPMAYENLQQARSIDTLTARLFDVTNQNLDLLIGSEFESETKSKSELELMTEKIKACREAGKHIAVV